MSSQQQVVEYMAGYLLDDRYVRIDAIQSDAQKAELAMDVATPRAQEIIIELSQRAIEAAAPEIGAFVGHRAAEVSFYNGSS